MVANSEDYSQVLDNQGNVQGYKWSGVYEVTATIDSFHVDLTTQANVDACGTPFDFTSFGGVTVHSTTLTTSIRVEGQFSSDLQQFSMESADFLQHDLSFETEASLGGLTRRLPLDYTGELHSLIEFLFAGKLEQPIVTRAQ